MPDFGIFRGFNDKLFGNKLYAGQLPTQLGLIGSQSLFDADAQAFFDRVTTAGGALSTIEKNAINTLVIDLKNYSLWSKMKAIYPMVGASAAACAQNLKSSSFTGTFTSGWTFASTGAKPNGTSAYMDTGLKPNGNLSQNSTHLASYIRNSTTGVLLGSDVNARTWIAPNFNGSQKYVQINDNTATPSATISAAVGLWIGSRTSSTSLTLYNNSTNNYSPTITSTGLDTVNLYLACRNTAPAANFHGGEISYSSIGDGLSSTEVGDFYTAVQAFQTTLSRQV
jgi:hypothetical protein